MKSFTGQLAEPSAKEVARYQRGRFTIICKTFENFYFITFHNGRQTSITRYTDNKYEANSWILDHAIKEGYKRV